MTAAGIRQDLAKFDARAAWVALDDDQRRTIGEAALLLIVASDVNTDDEDPVWRPEWKHAESEAWRLLDALAPDYRDYPGGPDLAALGIRACRRCGCTTESGCADGCWWVEPDLCSSCTA